MFPQHSRKLFSLDSCKSLHPVLEFSNHHQCNLQSEHTASRWRPAHLLTLATAPRLAVCSCHSRLGASAQGLTRGGCCSGPGATAHAHAHTDVYVTPSYTHSLSFSLCHTHTHTHTHLHTQT